MNMKLVSKRSSQRFTGLRSGRTQTVPGRAGPDRIGSDQRTGAEENQPVGQGGVSSVRLKHRQTERVKNLLCQ